MRFTTDNPTNNLQNALNLFFIKGHQAYVRGGGPEPGYEDVSLYDFIRRIVKTHNLDIPTADEEELSEATFERLFDGTDTMEGVVALLYTAGWAFSEIRGRLKKYEDTGMSPEQVATMKQERDAAMADIQRCCATCALCSKNNGTGEMCPWSFDCNQVDGDHWEWRGAEDTNVPSKEEE